MNKMSIPDTLMTEKFAAYLDSIAELYVGDNEFKSLCDDYHTSKKNTEKYLKKLEDDVHRKSAYDHLSLELEKEILRYLIKKNSG